MNLISAAAYIKRRWRPARRWPRETLLAWLAWFAGRGCAAIVPDGRGRIIGIGLARPVLDPQLASRQHYAFHEDGDGIFIDLLVADNSPAMAALWRALKLRFGPRDWIAMSRHKYNGKLIIHSMKTYDQKMEGLYGK